MKKILLFAAVAVLAISCSKTPTAKISATIEGGADTSVVLAKLLFNKLQAVDTIATDAAGHFDYKVKLSGNEPYFYYLYMGDNQLAALVLLDGDNVNVKASTIGGYEVEGSEESAKLQELNTMYGKAFNKLDALAKTQAPSAQLSRVYIDYRREVTKFIMNNPYSITSAVAAFQKFNDNLPVFSENADALIFQRVCDSLSTVYPSSEYIAALRDEIAARHANFDFQNKLSSVMEIGFPDLAMPDVNGQTQTLSGLKGKTIILSFWSIGQDEHKVFNQELLKLYNQYKSKGLEVYQVSLDIDKSAWAATVKSQNLPWINVNDGLGTQSTAVSSYNLQQIPAMFLIDKNGDLVAQNVFSIDELEKFLKKNL